MNTWTCRACGEEIPVEPVTTVRRRPFPLPPVVTVQASTYADVMAHTWVHEAAG